MNDREPPRRTRWDKNSQRAINTMDTRTGSITYFNLERGGYGFISSQLDGSSIVDKFFFHFSHVIFSECQVSEIRVGMFARFTPSTAPPKKPGASPFAEDVMVFASKESMTGGAR